MSFRTLFDIPFGIPNVYFLAPEKLLTASHHRSATVGSPVGRGVEITYSVVVFSLPLGRWRGVQKEGCLSLYIPLKHVTFLLHCVTVDSFILGTPHPCRKVLLYLFFFSCPSLLSAFFKTVNCQL